MDWCRMIITWKGAAVSLTAAAMLVIGIDYATFAATGDSLLLGKINHAQTTTKLVKQGAGPVLRLTSTGDNKPSLAVSSPARVRRLNADMLDGRTASTLASRAVTYKGGSRREVHHGSVMWLLPPARRLPGELQGVHRAQGPGCK